MAISPVDLKAAQPCSVVEVETRVSVAAFTGGEKAPSRIRVRQFIPSLKKLGVDMREFSSRAGTYPPRAKWKRPAWGLWNLAEHISPVIQSHQYAVTLLQREMLSTFITFEPYTKKPRVLDVDDAIWVHRRGDFARRLAEMSDQIICGNEFLAEKFSQWNSHISILPTAVDTDRFCPAEQTTDRPIIGWIGLSSGFSFLYGIELALADLLRHRPDAVLRIVSDRKPQFRLIPPTQLEFLQYDRRREIQYVQEMTIGIMPIDDSEWTRGKCSYKMLVYMACGLPVVVSPYGMNREVLAKGKLGIGARHDREWCESLETLLDDAAARARMGAEGRKIVLQDFSLHALAPRLAGILRSVAA